jgi:hypothetical protein
MAITGWREIAGLRGIIGLASLRMRALRWRAPRARRDRSGDGSSQQPTSLPTQMASDEPGAVQRGD